MNDIAAWKDSTANAKRATSYSLKIRAWEHENGFCDIIGMLSDDLAGSSYVTHWVRNYRRENFPRFASLVVDKVLTRLELEVELMEALHGSNQ